MSPNPTKFAMQKNNLTLVINKLRRQKFDVVADVNFNKIQLARRGCKHVENVSWQTSQRESERALKGRQASMGNL